MFEQMIKEAIRDKDMVLTFGEDGEFFYGEVKSFKGEHVMKCNIPADASDFLSLYEMKEKVCKDMLFYSFQHTMFTTKQTHETRY